MTYSDLYAKTVELLGSRFDANQLFSHVTQKRVHHLPFVGSKQVPEKTRKMLISMCEQRRSGVPLQYILGEWEFYGLPFKVGRGVLIPRADTETLVDKAIALMKDAENPQILDLCSGSGCIAVAISHHLPHALVTALELSDFAFEYLLKNIKLNRCPVTAVKADLDSYTHPAELDLIVSNPPYIPAETIASLQAEVWFEPRSALNGGVDGLNFYRSMSKLYYNQLKPGGWLCVEVGKGQDGQVLKIFTEGGYREVGTENDLGGVPRVVFAKK